MVTQVEQIDAKRVLREIKIMKCLKHENILGLSNAMYMPKDGYGDSFKTV